MPALTLTAPRTPLDIELGQRVLAWLRKQRLPADYSYDGSHVRVAMPFYGERELQAGLDALTAWNIGAMQAKPLPPIYSAGVRYKREPVCRTDGVVHICEEWLSAHEAVKRGTADCDDLGPWLAASLRLAGDANARAIPKRSPAGWHIVVRRGDGTIEDPSAKLGMPTR